MRPCCCCHWPPRSRSANGSRMLGSKRRNRQHDVHDDEDGRNSDRFNGQLSRVASSASQSPSSCRPMTRRPADSNADRTSDSRSWKTPPASSRPPGQTAAYSSVGKVDQHAGDQVGNDEVELRAARRSGRLPDARLDHVRARPFSSAFLAVISTDSGSMSIASTVPPEQRPPRWPGCPSRYPHRERARRPSGPRPTTPRFPPGTAASSGAARCRRPCPGRC